MRSWKLAPFILAPFLMGSACTDLFAPDPAAVVAPAEEALKEGNLPEAYAQYDKAATDNATMREAQIGAAYAYMLAGEYDKADNTLSALEEGSEDVGDIKLRRAMVALAAGEYDSVKEHGVASETAAGAVMAAEVHLADAESDDALNLLKGAADEGGPVGRTATKYVEMLESGDQFQAGLAEATALWALGDRESACDAAEELVKGLETDDKGELLLLWAGRAVTSDRVEVASGLLEEAEFADIPPDHAWRVQATASMVQVANGECATAQATFTLLAEAGAPADGLADARATAAALTDDKECAKALCEGLESAACARSLKEAGAGKAAKDQAPDGALSQFLENN